MASRIGAELVASPLIGTFIGVLLQKQWPQLSPWALIVGFTLGVASAFYTLFKTAKRFDQFVTEENKLKEDSDKKNQNDL